MKNDSVRSCLIELQSFLQSKTDVDPIYRVLMFLPCFMHVLCMTRCIYSSRSYQDPYDFCRWDSQAEREYCLSFAHFDFQVSIPN